MPSDVKQSKDGRKDVGLNGHLFVINYAVKAMTIIVSALPDTAQNSRVLASLANLEDAVRAVGNSLWSANLK